MYCAISKLHKKPYKTDKSKPSTIYRKIFNSKKHTDKRNLFKKKQTSTESTNISMYGNYRPGEYIVVDLKHMPKSIHGDEYLCVFTCILLATQ